VAETGSEDEAVDLSEDDFFMGGSSSDDVDADDEWTDKSPRLGEERDDTSKELVPPAPRPVQNKSSRLLDPAVEKKTVKGSKQAPANGKDQVFMMDRQFTFMPLLRDLGLWVLVSSDRYARELAACSCY
jgi:hypothetical protein